jgi:hypothetical protein
MRLAVMLEVRMIGVQFPRRARYWGGFLSADQERGRDMKDIPFCHALNSDKLAEGGGS